MSDRNDTSARSLLVTVFGDTILPATTNFLLAELFPLTEALGFNERLVRTSLSRLASDGWVRTEKVGRQSRYHLTELAQRESAEAERRIYHDTSADWTGDWTLVVTDSPLLEAEARANIVRHLGWNGFIRLGASLLGSPTAAAEEVDELVSLIEPGVRLPVLTGSFKDADQLVASGYFSAAFDTEGIARSYRVFIDAHRPLVADEVTGLDAFVARSLLIHDLRRIRLRTPDVPRQLLPDPWIGDEAMALAGSLYEDLSRGCADAIGSHLSMRYPAIFPKRFS